MMLPLLLLLFVVACARVEALALTGNIGEWPLDVRIVLTSAESGHVSEHVRNFAEAATLDWNGAVHTGRAHIATHYASLLKDVSIQRYAPISQLHITGADKDGAMSYFFANHLFLEGRTGCVGFAHTLERLTFNAKGQLVFWGSTWEEASKQVMNDVRCGYSEDTVLHGTVLSERIAGWVYNLHRFLERKKIKDTMRGFAKDAVLRLTGRADVVGTAAIQRFFELFYKDLSLMLYSTHSHVHVAGLQGAVISHLFLVSRATHCTVSIPVVTTIQFGSAGDIKLLEWHVTQGKTFAQLRAELHGAQCAPNTKRFAAATDFPKA